MSHPIETILKSGLKWLLASAVPLSVLGLLFGAPSDHESLYWYVNIHLIVLQLITFAFAVWVTSKVTWPWFQETRRPWLASVASLVAAAVGLSALLTIATSAAARYDVSLQFLQLLSSLDIAWVVAAMYLGARALGGEKIGRIAGTLLLLACVASIAIYLARVGFTSSGGWLVDGAEMMAVVIPSDVAAAVMSLSVVLLASRKLDSSQETTQASVQS